MDKNRPNTSKQGSVFEKIAAEYLQKQGLEIVAQNVNLKFAELDIVAKDKDVLCFVEVRSRADTRYGQPEATVDFRKQGKIIKAASAYLQKLYPRIPTCRFDVIGITGSPERPIIAYYKNAFGLEPAYMGRRRGGPWQVY
jgi:putative endonuclease